MSDFASAQSRTDMVAMEAEVFERPLEDSDDLNWAMLIDDAFDQNARRLGAVTGQVNLYDRPALEGLISAAPRLIPLPRDDGARALLRRGLRHCSGRPMLSVISSRLSLQELQTYWEPVHWISTEDGQELLLRFADTRVLPTMPRILRANQWRTLAEPLAQWIYVDRNGRPAHCEKALLVEDSQRPILLTNDQVGAFISAAQPDAMVNYMQEHLSDALPEGTTSLDCFRWAVEVCALADAHEFDAWADRISLLCAYALTRGACGRHPELARLLASHGWSPGQLGQALQTLEILGEVL